MSLSKEEIAKVLDALKAHGTYVAAAKAINIHTATLYQERKRNKTFRTMCNEAIEQGKTSVGDRALNVIEEIAFGKDAKDQQRLTAALALAMPLSPALKFRIYTRPWITNTRYKSSPDTKT